MERGADYQGNSGAGGGITRKTVQGGGITREIVERGGDYQGNSGAGGELPGK